MITIRQLNSNQEIEEASHLLYQIYIIKEQWKFSPQNPSQLRIEIKNDTPMLIDRVTFNAVWFGAFENGDIVGCIRLFGLDHNNQFEIEDYPSQVINAYIMQDSKKCVEVTKLGLKEGYAHKLVVQKLFLAVFKYCNNNQLSIFACTHYKFLINFFNKIDYQLKIEHAFKYESTDKQPVNFYYANYINGELNNMIKKIENSHESLKPKYKSKILDALELISPLIPSLLYWHDQDGIVLGLNEQCLKGIGEKRENVVGKSPYDFYPKETAEHILQHNKKVMKTEQILSQEEKIADITTGKIKYFTSIKAPLYDDNNNVIGIIGTSIDITAEKEAEQLKIQNATYQANLKAQMIFKESMNKIQSILDQAKLTLLNSKMGGSEKSVTETHKIELSKREKEVLYFLSLGKSPKEIAFTLSKLENKTIASATIGGLINKQLYPKLNVFNVSQLLEKATMLQLIPFIHDSLLQTTPLNNDLDN